MKVLVACNTLSEVDSQPYPSHIVHAFRMGKDNPDIEFILFTPRRMAIATARNQAAEYALKTDCDYVFYYDDDMELHPETFKTLLSRDKDIIMAMCYIRGYPFKPMVFKWLEGEEAKIADVTIEGKVISLWQDCEKSINEQGLIVNPAAIGCAATLVKTSVFKALEYPWFYTGTANTEDVYFCMKAQKELSGVTIAVDTTVPAGHILKDRRVLYPWNADILRRHEEEFIEHCRKHYADTANPAEKET